MRNEEMRKGKGTEETGVDLIGREVDTKRE